MVEANMYRGQITGNWHIMKGKFWQRWGEYTNKDLDYLISGFEEERAGKVQTLYGISKKEADQMIKDWLESDHSPYWNSSSASGGGGGTMGVS